MDSANLEKNEELLKLEKKESDLVLLYWKTEGKFLSAQDPESAKNFLYEWLFVQLATWQLASQVSRLRGHEDDVESWVDELRKYRELLNQVELGHWSEAKNEFANQAVNDYQNDWPDEMMKNFEMDSEYAYLFPYVVEEGKEFDEATGKWDSFVEGKIKIVPDQSVPYVYPYMHELKAKLSS